MVKPRKLETTKHFSATVKPPAPTVPPAASPPLHEPRNPPGAMNYVPTQAEEQLIARIRNPKCGISAFGQSIAENLVRHNVATTEGMTATEIAIFKRLAIECDVTLELKASQ